MPAAQEVETKLAAVKQRYQALLKQSQNPHADPVLKSLQMAIQKLEKQAREAQ